MDKIALYNFIIELINDKDKVLDYFKTVVMNEPEKHNVKLQKRKFIFTETIINVLPTHSQINHAK
jgi:hypothetical protein